MGEVRERREILKVFPEIYSKKSQISSAGGLWEIYVRVDAHPEPQ